MATAAKIVPLEVGIDHIAWQISVGASNAAGGVELPGKTPNAAGLGTSTTLQNPAGAANDYGVAGDYVIQNDGGKFVGAQAAVADTPPLQRTKLGAAMLAALSGAVPATVQAARALLLMGEFEAEIIPIESANATTPWGVDAQIASAADSASLLVNVPTTGAGGGAAAILRLKFRPGLGGRP